MARANGRAPDQRRDTYWRRMVRGQRQSGLTIREFCHRSRLRESTFYFWRRELERRQAEGRSGGPPSAAPAFLPVTVKHEGITPAGRIEIELSGGRRIHVTAPVDRAALEDVLAVLEGRPC